MGSFPSVLEEPAHVLTAGGESGRAMGSHAPLSVHPRAHTLILKKLTRGKVVLLGIDGAGKSTFARQLIRVASGDSFSNSGSSFGAMAGNNDLEPTAYYPDPTVHQVAWSYRVACDRYLQLVDLPGRREARAKWYAGLKSEPTSSTGNHSSSSGGAGGGTHLNTLPLRAIVFVVDASDRMRFPIVAAELARLQTLRDRSSTLAKAPFFLLLNKTDRYFSLQPNQQQLPTSSASQHQFQAQLREVRAELRKCVDYELKMLQRRRPDTSTASTSSTTIYRTASTLHLAPNPLLARESMLAVDAGHKRTQVPTCTVMNSVMECCSHDLDSIGAVHAWIKDEMKKAQ